MSTRITTLVDNLAQGQGILGEHGLAFLIEAPAGNVLFDTGQSSVLLHNAEVLQLDLAAVDAVVLSHGHYDHTGGLLPLLEQRGGLPVHAHPAALQPKYAVSKTEARSIGIPVEPAVLERAGARFQLHDGPREVFPGITATGPVPRVTGFETVTSRFRLGPALDAPHDTMKDDQALIVQTEAGPVLLLGCTHSGLINTLRHVCDLIGQTRLAAVLGGTHLVDADANRIQQTISELERYDIERLGACHCTGFRGQVALSSALGERFVLNAAGTQYTF